MVSPSHLSLALFGGLFVLAPVLASSGKLGSSNPTFEVEYKAKIRNKAEIVLALLGRADGSTVVYFDVVCSTGAHIDVDGHLMKGRQLRKIDFGGHYDAFVAEVREKCPRLRVEKGDFTYLAGQLEHLNNQVMPSLLGTPVESTMVPFNRVVAEVGTQCEPQSKRREEFESRGQGSHLRVDFEGL
ncbi:hypothetical protein FOZ62_019438 [Perkinsus olseni]|uniref:Uncharacterized protein n=1 Tax=Perkinsus olseni TaxID=32597 RepID=A0A7J6U0A2_PEROL|nr:hypothetical protein FOZ62_019438 [Perkinsus olseni]